MNDLRTTPVNPNVISFPLFFKGKGVTPISPSPLRGDDDTDVGGTSPRMGEVESSREQRSRAKPGAFAEGGGEGGSVSPAPGPQPAAPSSSPPSPSTGESLPRTRSGGWGEGESVSPAPGPRIPVPSLFRGVSLIESLVAIIILSFALLGLAFLQAQGMKSNTGAYARTQATILAYDILDRIRANPADAVNLKYETATPSSTCSATVANVENDLKCWNDALSANLPSGAGSIDVTATIPAIAVTVTLTWNAQLTRKLSSDTSTATPITQTLTVSTEIPLPI